MTDRRLTATIAGPPLVASRRDRTLSGAVLPWDAVGYTSVGPTRFARGSVQVPENAGVVLNLEHDQTRPIGYATQLVDGPDALSGTFRLSDTTAGRDALAGGTLGAGRARGARCSGRSGGARGPGGARVALRPGGADGPGGDRQDEAGRRHGDGDRRRADLYGDRVDGAHGFATWGSTVKDPATTVRTDEPIRAIV